MSDDKFRQMIAPLQEFAQTMLEVGDLRTALDPRIKPEWIVERDGKPTLPFEFLVKIAHDEGLQSMDSCILQFPSSDNDHAAVVKGIVMLDGKPFSAHADSSRANTGGKFGLFLIATAETRAYGRALRNGLGITMLCFEEIGDESQPDRTGGERAAYTPAPQGPTPISGAQAVIVRRELDKRGMAEPDDLDEWTSDRAIEYIGSLRDGTVAEVAQ